HRPLLNQFAISILPLPTTYAQYLRGRSRRAVRTNLRRSLARGTVCSIITNHELRTKIVQDIMAQRKEDPSELLDRAESSHINRTFFVAQDNTGKTLAIAEIILDKDWVGLVTLITAHNGLETKDARYQLHSHIVEYLIAHKKQYLFIGGNALPLAPNLHYFQQILGYKLFRVQLATKKGNTPSAT
ncbi:MAG: hypothetical protein ACRCSF_05185, partial [Mycobacteriaceae bacterium]